MFCALRDVVTAAQYPSLAGNSNMPVQAINAFLALPHIQFGLVGHSLPPMQIQGGRHTRQLLVRIGNSFNNNSVYV